METMSISVNGETTMIFCKQGLCDVMQWLGACLALSASEPQ